jgi:hypothetical protein
MATEDSMDQRNYQEALELLCQNGFTAAEIERLCQLRRDYSEQEQNRVVSADLRRLAFVRWLVTTGRLTDQLDV